jgi:hypothetical protein
LNVSAAEAAGIDLVPGRAVLAAAVVVILK